jgi:predicted outer membrane protein
MKRKLLYYTGLLVWAALFLFLTESCSPGSDNAETKGENGNPLSTITSPATEKEFVLSAYSYNLMLIHYSELAQKKELRGSVASFISLSVPLHKKQNRELTAVAASKNWELPKTVGEDVKAYSQELDKLEALAFEQAYLKVISDIQKKSVPLYEAASDYSDTILAGWAANALPKLEAHTETVDQLLAEARR